MTFDSHAFKQEFPLFQHADNSSLVYLDNAATTQRPQCVIDAMVDFYSRFNANTHRSSHRLARTATAMVESVRVQAAQFLNAAQPQEVIFTRGATESLNLLASSLCQNLKAGDEIILSAAEHHANLVPWQMAAQKHQLVLKFLPSVQGEPQLSELSRLVTPRTAAVALSAASNALGFRVAIETVKPKLSDTCVLVVDASQRLAHEVIDVQSLQCDFLVGSAHKFYGPTGIGILYGRRDALAQLPPWQGGGEMIDRVGLHDSDFAQAPHRFEAGTSSLAAIAGLGACLNFLQSQDRAAMAVYESHLNRYLHTELEALSLSLPFQLLTQFENNVGIAAIVGREDASLDVTDMADWLDEHDIAVRVGHHCAQPLMEPLGGSSLRISLAAYNNRGDVDALIACLKKIPQQLSESIGCDKVGVNAFGDDLSDASIESLTGDMSWQKRYRQLTRWSTLLSRKPDIRLDHNRVKGCESEVWITHRSEGHHHYFAIDTDSRVLQGLSVLILLLLDGKTTEQFDAVDVESTFVNLGLEKYLSESRSNGFRALVDSMAEKIR
ncbi:MAG: aminotransferase class V-fold PLP-dependent enzyme [Cellvibrionaceae bacterium]